ncbi:MAG: hypothetical protein J6T13_02055 [Bacteroidales bacterium]|nr:hypothetical protein [Bacteroidales bacterium]
MEVYIDKENLRSFIRARKNPQYSDCYDDCYRMLKRQLHINYNFAKTKELLNDDELKNYFILSGQGNGDSEADSYATEIFPSRHVGMNTPANFNRKHSSAVYLIDDEGVDSFRDVGTSLVGDVKEEIDVLRRLFCGNDYDFHKLYNLQTKKSFPKWEQLKDDNLLLPLSDIIVMDRYVGANQRYATYNILKLLELLVEQAQNKVNVVILCDKHYYNKYKNAEETPNWSAFRHKIINVIREKTNIEPNVTFVFNSGNNHPHDRMIFTNYMLFRSGDSFNYFDNNGNLITQGNSLDVNSLAKKSNYEFAEYFLNEVQKFCDAAGASEDNVMGDKKSNYIQFPE